MFNIVNNFFIIVAFFFYGADVLAFQAATHEVLAGASWLPVEINISTLSAASSMSAWGMPGITGALTEICFRQILAQSHFTPAAILISWPESPAAFRCEFNRADIVQKMC